MRCDASERTNTMTRSDRKCKTLVATVLCLVSPVTPTPSVVGPSRRKYSKYSTNAAMVWFNKQATNTNMIEKPEVESKLLSRSLVATYRYVNWSFAYYSTVYILGPTCTVLPSFGVICCSSVRLDYWTFPRFANFVNEFHKLLHVHFRLFQFY
jgi:hypothetical protein